MLKTAFSLLDKDIEEGRVTIEIYEEDGVQEQKLVSTTNYSHSDQLLGIILNVFF